MIWREEKYRMVAVCGAVDIGAVYPPVGAGRTWRWRIWINRTGHAHEGREASRERAKAQVEHRFRDFIDAAQLVQIGGGL